MVFNEDNCINVSNLPNTMIYFLLKNKEVVYVGQTKLGMCRIQSHYSVKDFDEIFVMPCNDYELDYLEDIYIKKYNPSYNKMLNINYNYSLDKVKNILNNNFTNDKSDKKYTKYKLQKIINLLNIKIIDFKGASYLYKDDVNKIYDYIERSEVQ